MSSIVNERKQTTGEEIANAVTHGIGALLSVAGLVILVAAAAGNGTAWHVTAFAIFGASSVLLYVSSTLYHSLTGERAKYVFLVFDHASIYVLISGSYTAFLLTLLRGPLGWTLFGILWGGTVFGIVMKALYLTKFPRLSLVLYALLGWIIVAAWTPLRAAASPAALRFLVAGGLSYTVGIPFFALGNRRWFHFVWHLFVLGGTVCHFFAVLNIL